MNRGEKKKKEKKKHRRWEKLSKEVASVLTNVHSSKLTMLLSLMFFYQTIITIIRSEFVMGNITFRISDPMNATPRIVGGELTSIRKYPFLVCEMRPSTRTIATFGSCHRWFSCEEIDIYFPRKIDEIIAIFDAVRVVAAFKDTLDIKVLYFTYYVQYIIYFTWRLVWKWNIIDFFRFLTLKFIDIRNHFYLFIQEKFDFKSLKLS